jgi:hypothetical protein
MQKFKNYATLQNFYRHTAKFIIISKDVCVMAFLGPHDLSSRVFQSAAISAGGLALSVCAMRLLGFVCLR